jgi:hypothetical protein
MSIYFFATGWPFTLPQPPPPPPLTFSFTIPTDLPAGTTVTLTFAPVAPRSLSG